MPLLIDSPYANSHKSIVMCADSGSNDLQSAIRYLGEEIGKKVVENYFLDTAIFSTPMDVKVERAIPKIPLCAVITTKDDFEYLGNGISSVLHNSIKGYMDFQGQRGVQALTAEITHMMLPEPKGQNVHTLVVAKAVLATGCTAIHLTKTAMSKYLPRSTIVASVFYSEQGIAELNHALPNADILVVGEPDFLNNNGMLIPGVGNLDQRLRG